MPKPSERTRSRRRVSLPLPGGIAIHYKHERVGAPHCARCGRILHGVPSLIPSRLSKLSASQKRLGRFYGGQICPMCLKELLKGAVRSATA